MLTTHIQVRKCDKQVLQQLSETTLSPLLAKIVANRIQAGQYPHLEQLLTPHLRYISAPQELADCDVATQRIVTAILQPQHIAFVTDYDVDGACSHACLKLAFKDYFQVPDHRLHSFIGHRIQDGYGLSPHLCARILQYSPRPNLIITADCGSSDEPQIQRLQAVGIDVIVTDHHAIPKAGIPASAYTTINPTRQDCHYPDKTIAGCMVAWLLMSAVRSALIEKHYLSHNSPKLSALLDFISLGTVADAVSLSSPINRAIVNAGLQIMNHLQRPCWQAIHTLLKQAGQVFNTEDLGFQIGPRINARSRMADPYAALHYLLAPQLSEAQHYLHLLDQDNIRRQQVEKAMIIKAKQLAKSQLAKDRQSLVIYHPDFHMGVQGIVASRLVDSFGRPSIVFSPTPDPNILSGSARTVDIIHIRKALQAVYNQTPQLLLTFGGHKGAAGMKIHKKQFAAFSQTFEAIIKQQLGSTTLHPAIWTDGVLESSEITLDTFHLLEQLQPYGREFEAPVFSGLFYIEQQQVIGKGDNQIHLKLQLSQTLLQQKMYFPAIWFKALPYPGATIPLQAKTTIQIVYQLNHQQYRGKKSLQLLIRHAQQADHSCAM